MFLQSKNDTKRGSEALGDWSTLYVAGDFDAKSAETLRPRLEALSNQDHENVRVDLSDVSFIDSSGIGALVFLYKRVTASGRKMVISGINGQPKTVLTSLGIDKTIPIEAGDAEAALAHARQREVASC